ncbi:hypothetical protein [uncultured Lamprocystis sp.]|uniref:ISAzo13-like element transposase-related protein n=1 Tax=uncultured Lamprocystis sp. TaxID=543132 RepID=UPI0025EDCF15|nr:hypothetical protein [uncultured Lamprocystis sp.]
MGPSHRRGQCDSTVPQRVRDYDDHHPAGGVLVPHGVYNVVANRGFIALGTSHGTSTCACDALFLAWTLLFCYCYPTATEILVLCDGGSNNTAHSLRYPFIWHDPSLWQWN